MLPQSNNIFQIQRRYLELLQQIEDAEGEITPEIDQALQFTEQQMHEAAVNVGMIIKALEYNKDNIDAEIKRLTNLKHKTEKSKELLKNRLSTSMQQFGIEKVSSPTLSISFRKSRFVEITNEAVVPAAYFDQPQPKISKERLAEALKAGQIIPGAEYSERKNIQIK
jgi:hypothetical protein